MVKHIFSPTFFQFTNRRIGRRIFGKIQTYLYVTPVYAFIALFVAYPVVFLLVFSLFDVPLNLKYTFVGLMNFERLSRDPKFFKTFIPAIVFVGGSVAGQNGFGFFLALLLNRKVKGVDFLRAVFIMPWLISDLILGYMFLILFDAHGTINEILKTFGLQRVEWLMNTDLTIWIVTLANIWKSSCIVMAMHSSGLQSISEELYEAAHVDGASLWRRFQFITLPLMRPFIALSLIITTVATFNYFGVIYIITYGGPLDSTTVPAFYMYRWALEWGQLGYASTIGVFILIINIIFTAAYVKILLR